MKILAKTLAGGCALLVVAAALLAMTPPGQMFLAVAWEALRPETISWDGKTASRRCESAIAGATRWPESPARACAAVHMCANEAKLNRQQYSALVAATRRVPDCGAF